MANKERKNRYELEAIIKRFGAVRRKNLRDSKLFYCYIAILLYCFTKFVRRFTA